MRPISKLPPLSLLRELIAYDPSTGLMVWRERKARHFRNPAMLGNWNSRHAGKPAIASIGSHGYQAGYVSGQMCLAHRVAWALHYGEDPSFEIDHINGCATDNRIDNLRASDPLTNNRNLARPRNNTSGTVGVAFIPGRWRATITVDNRAIHLGYFETEAEAIAARKAAEREYGFHPNHGRDFFVDAA